MDFRIRSIKYNGVVYADVVDMLNVTKVATPAELEDFLKQILERNT